MEKIIYTIEPTDGGERPVEIEYDDVGGYQGIAAKPVKLSISVPVSGFDITHVCRKVSITIDPQQLMELGALLLALAGIQVDFDSADELLEGYSLKGKEAARKLAKALRE